MMNTLFFMAGFLTLNLAFASDKDGAFLDPAYKVHVHPKRSVNKLLGNLPAKSDLEVILAFQTPVRSQGARGTCSIFSATAMYEATLVKLLGAPKDIDLSEEWLEYLIMRTQGSEGSGSYKNFNTLVSYGSPRESTLPYLGETWEEADVYAGSLAQKRCGSLTDFNRTACLLGHYHPGLLNAPESELTNSASPLYAPEFLKARSEAAAMKAQVAAKTTKTPGIYVGTVDDVKKALLAGVPITVDVDFYYGAWNHREAPEKGIPRNMDHWYKGVVGYPEEGTVDRRESLADPAGHSILLIGYDDEVTVETEQLMEDGSSKKFTYKGVYYFKNSWGTDSFGSEMVINGKARKGYGMITQKYAEQYGTFYQFPLNLK